MNRPARSGSWIPIIAFATVTAFVGAMAIWIRMLAAAGGHGNAYPWILAVTVASSSIGFFVGTSITRRRIVSSMLVKRDLLGLDQGRHASAAVDKRREIVEHVFGKASDAFFANRSSIRHFMRRDVCRVLPTDSIKKVTVVMAEQQVNRVFVCDDGFQLRGVITKKDLHQRTGRTASKIMTPDPIQVTPDDRLESVAELMLGNSLSCLPVCLDGLLVGQIDTMDLIVTMECAFDVLQSLADELRDGTPSELAVSAGSI